MEINKALYEEIFQNVKAILRNKPNSTVGQISKRLSVVSFKSTRVQPDRKEIEEYINKFVEDGIITIKDDKLEEEQETAEERHRRFAKNFKFDVKEQHIEEQLKKDLNSEKDNKPTAGFHIRNGNR